MEKSRINSKVFAVLMALILVFSSLILPAKSTAETTASTYWLKVNTKANVVNVYKKSGTKWVPYKVMLCSCGLATNEDNTTPAGTYKLNYKWRWLALVANSYGQYVSQITGDYLFHSVPYNERYNHASQPTAEFNKLGKKASHGCVRLSVMDAKWIYENCPSGTKITVYSSDKPGPLGKPTPIKVSTSKKTGWDPTDPKKGNPNFKLRKPVITTDFGNKLTVKYGKKTPLLSLVQAKDPNTFRDLTKSIKFSYVKKYSKSKGQYVKAKFSCTSPGKYKVRYKVYNKYCGTGYKTIYVTVSPKPVPPKPVEPDTPDNPNNPVNPDNPDSAGQ